ncbi:MAG: endonuclease, partial [Christiangramia sp.]|nr:endonuclease [Christiangramia sp.]
GDSDRCAETKETISVGDAGSPVAENDSYQTEEDKEYTISNFTENDVVVDNSVVTEVYYEGGNATVSFNQETGIITYLPNPGFSGEDSFTYTLCDDDETPNCSTGTISMTVIDEGDPVANDDEVVVGNTISKFVISNLLENDTVIDDAIIASVNDDNSSGSASLNEDGTVSYSPNTGFEGTDSFTYTLCDDDPEASCVTATVTVKVVTSVNFNIPASLMDYYSTATFAQDGDLLYDALQSFTTTMHVNRLEYTDRHDYLYDADEDPANPDNVILVYSGESRPEDEYWTGDTQDPWETFNTEHIYPQSKLSSEVAIGDLHLLRSADIDDNTERSNHPYADGSGSYGPVGNDEWYPGDDWRGDVARMVMYVNLRYGEPFEDVGSLALFLEWNIEDPVSDFEMQRNNVIEAAQGNRNPFIDNPYLATLIWGGADAENRWE